MTSVRRVLALVALGLAVLPARAAKLPEWAAAIAAGAPPLSEEAQEFPWRVLLSETLVAAQPDGRLVVRRRVAQQATRGTTAEIGTGWFHFDDDAKIKTARAWHLAPGEKVQKTWGPPLDVTVDPSFLTDSRARVVGVSGVRAGSLVFFEFEALDKPAELAVRSLFFENAPTDRMRLVIETPEGWTVRHAWLRQDGPEPIATGLRRVFELSDLAAPVDEPLGLRAADRAPLLVVGLAPPAGAAVGPLVAPDWLALSAWYETLAAGRDAATPEVAAVASSLGSATGFVDRLRAAGAWVRDRVRYVDKEVGVGGYQPRPASQVARDLYGDCKDKSTLLRSLLREAGLTGYPLLVHATARDTVSETIPSLTSFNHMVLGVVWPADEELSGEFQPALVDAGELGRFLVVDPTAEHAAIGSMPAALAGKTALLVAGPKSRLVTLPAGNPQAHRVERRIEIDARETGGAGVRFATRYFGEPALMARAETAASSLERREAVREGLHQRWPRASIGEYAAHAWDTDGAFVETVSVEISPPRAGDSALLGLFPLALEALPRVPLAKRKTAVTFPYPIRVRAETIVRGAPAETGLPEAQSSAGDGWSVATHYERADDGALHGSLEIDLARVDFAPEAFDELKRFWSSATQAASPAIPLTTGAP